MAIVSARFLLAAALLGLPLAPARAWGPLGHRLAARIAQERLSPGARKAVEGLFGPGDALVRIATCADDVLRSTTPVDCAGVALEPDRARATEPWHFINIPVAVEADTASIGAYCPAGSCVVAQVRERLDALAGPPEDRRLAVIYLVHLVADLHQPLHCADDDDLGGNRKPVSFHGKKKRLHEIFDDVLVVEDKDLQRTMSLAPFLPRLRRLARRKAAAERPGDLVARAALESHAAARGRIYPEYHAAPHAPRGEAYGRKMQELALDRVAAAGVRLGMLLDQALSR